MNGQLEIITAFSRDQKDKVYVQHRLKEHGETVSKLIDEKAYFYVCGDAANMAREVNQVLIQLIADQRGISKEKAEGVVKSLRAANQYQEDVWS